MTTPDGPARRLWPVAVEPAGPVSVGATLWRFRGQLRATIVAKATFELERGGEMKLVAPDEIRGSEEYPRGDPRCSILAAAELAPHLARCDVVFTGHAHAPPRTRAERVLVRLAVEGQGGAMRMDKRLEVVGDRVLRPGTLPGAPEPFERLPIVFERAYGGIGWAENPIGIGVGGAPDGRGRAPNIVHPERGGGGVNPPGLAPISAGWPARRRLLGALPRRTLEALVAEIPEDFDWSYFQAAPVDQRIDWLHGDEWILLEGLHPRFPVTRTRLPSVVASARVVTADEAELPLRLRADTLAIDGDRERCAVVWRGSFPVPALEVLATLRVAAGVSLPGMPVAWPEHAPLSQTQILDLSSEPEPPRTSFDNTITLDDEDLLFENAPAQKPPKPPPARAVRRDVPGAPWSREQAAPVPRPRSPFDGTLELDGEAPVEEPARKGK